MVEHVELIVWPTFQIYVHIRLDRSSRYFNKTTHFKYKWFQSEDHGTQIVNNDEKELKIPNLETLSLSIDSLGLLIMIMIYNAKK